MISDGESFPSTSSICQRIADNEQHTVWYSLPNGHGFLGTNIHRGQLYLFVHVLMDSSKQLTQLGVYCSVILAFHVSMISQTSQKRSLKAGGCLAVIARAFRIASNHFLDMNEPNLNRAPMKQSTSPMDQKLGRSGPLIVAMRNHKPSQRRNSP